MLAAAAASAPVKDNVAAAYGIYMFDPVKQTWLIVAAPPAGFMCTDPVAIQSRPEPNATEPTSVDAALAAQNMALIEVRSVYDTDGLQRMGEQMLTAADLPAGCAQGIAMTTPTDALDTRARVADLSAHEGPGRCGLRLLAGALRARHCAPWHRRRARWACVRRSARPTSSSSRSSATRRSNPTVRSSCRCRPTCRWRWRSSTRKGRAIQTHTNWIQVRPGERRTCDGCHSPRRGAALNSGAVVNTMPAALKQTLAAHHLSGETMASLRTRLDATVLSLKPDMIFTDVWADTSSAGVTARQAISMRYTGNPNPADDLATPAPSERPDQLSRAHRSRCGRATAAPTPAPAATPTRPSSTCAPTSRAPAGWCRTKS